MKKLVTIATMMAFVGLLLTTGALAQTEKFSADEPTPTQPRSPSTAPTLPPGAQAGPEAKATLGMAKELYAGTLMGASVKNLQGENLGKIHELVIDPQHAQIKMAVVSMGGLLGIGGKTVAVPWGQLKSADDGKTFIIAKAKEELDSAPEWKKPEAERKEITEPARESAIPPMAPRPGSTPLR